MWMLFHFYLKLSQIITLKLTKCCEIEKIHQYILSFKFINKIIPLIQNIGDIISDKYFECPKIKSYSNIEVLTLLNFLNYL